MGKADLLLKEMSGNLSESIGVRSEAPIRSFRVAAPQEIPTASPKDGFTRNRAAGEMLLENIVPDPSQPRKEFAQEAVERLAESIKARGLLQPLRVRWNPELGKHVILVGERRYRAAKLAGLVSVPCTFVETELSDAEVLEEQLVENLLREDLNPIEEAHSFKRYMELMGCHAKDLARLLKVAPSTVTRALSLLKLPGEVQEQVATGDIPAKTGFEIAKLGDEGARKAVADRVVKEKLTADDAAKVVRQKKGKPAQKKGRGVTETFRLDGGIRITVTMAKKTPPEQIASALEEAAAQARARVA
jgi:ParB family chromosome partitioning protein